jgi:hypothetical protein
MGLLPFDEGSALPRSLSIVGGGGSVSRVGGAFEGLGGGPVGLLGGDAAGGESGRCWEVRVGQERPQGDPDLLGGHRAGIGSRPRAA